MKTSTGIATALLSIGLVGVACSTVPLTGRKQIDFVPGETMLAMSYQQYDEFLKANTISDDPVQTETVKRAGQRVKVAVEKYLAANGLSHRLENYQWEFNLVESQEPNAWCMPGGKVVVYTGLLPITQDENGLAVVMAHEIAHAIARHGDERLSQGLLTEFGGMALTTALEKQPEKTKKLWMTAFGVGAQVGVLLPFSRLHEKEADHLGLIFMAMAGYDPNGAVAFWERMAKLKEGQPNLPFLSTHPSDTARIANIKAELPEAMKHYQAR